VVNKNFPYCATAARHMLCEGIGLKPGDRIPGHSTLTARARKIKDDGPQGNLAAWDLVSTALGMLDEIGGL
jgi:hypothetical protein